ncbi:hypothetical protein PVAP13_6NG080500 [Panicum virgatum]|uniref:Zinc finger GRF-type domain-containing protein n=1 Tax=Panicum virgatum TaxID=38727 RepID=A0A8T0QVL9_PANVG|nr:hypothetical protein PVAP13_6NG080500 [Panicum virgatum]
MGGFQSPHPLLNCSKCGVQLVRIISKQRATFGQAFVKCPNNIKGDPTTCGIIMSEAQYEAWLRKPEQQQQIQSKMYLCSGEGGHESIDHILDLKEELNEVKQKLDSVVADLWVVKVQVQKMKMDYVVVAAVCVGVAIGCLMSKL